MPPANQILADGEAVIHPNQVVAYATLKRLVELKDGSLADIKLTHQIYHWTDPEGTTHMMSWEQPECSTFSVSQSSSGP